MLNKRRFRKKEEVSVPGKRRRQPQLVEDVVFNCALINCRSLKPKIKSLSECFKMNKLSVALLNETWLHKSDKQAKHLLQELKNESGIEILRKDRDSRGGGVALAYDSNVLSLKKLNLNSLKNKPRTEIVAARGKLRGYKREFNIFSCYLTPKLTKAESTEFMETLSNAIAEAKVTSDGWFVVGGDWNQRPMTGILDLYPDIKQIATAPTRKDRVLDIIMSNINPHSIKNIGVTAPLEGEHGQVSDHKTVVIESLLPRPRAFSWEVHEYLEVTKKGTEEFIQRLEAEQWPEILENYPQVDNMVEAFHKILNKHLFACFRWRRVRRKSTDKPWISDGVRARIKKRKAIFWNEGRSETWKRIDKAIKRTIAFRKKMYEEKMTRKLEESGKNGQWYSVYKFMSSDEMPNRWNITELKPNQHPKQLANELADHFVKITNQASKLMPS